jgi:hypothetical protein
MKKTLILLLPFFLHAAPMVETQADSVRVDLGNSTTLRFALRDGFLLGLAEASIQGVPLKSTETVVRPVLNQEFADGRVFFEFMRLNKVEPAEGGVDLHLDLLATDSEEAYRAFYSYTADLERAATENLPPDLMGLQEAAAAAAKQVEPFLIRHKDWKKWTDESAKAQADIAAGKDPQGQKAKIVRQHAHRMRENRERILRQVARDGADLAYAAAAFAAYDAALLARGLELGKIHRDYYEFAHLRLPAETSRLDPLVAALGQRAAAAKPAGTLVWRLRPQERVIAGWPWRGWSSQYVFQLDGGRQVNVLRQVGSWELGGKIEGLTLVNYRYRGLGGIEHAVSSRDGVAVSTFSTTEILPGAVGGGPVISPALPAPQGSDFSDRGYAMRHRTGAWIGRMARGAGVGFVDFQYRPEAILLSTFERMDNLRALTELFPGDREVSQTDEWWFANTDRHATEPQLYLALVPEKPFTRSDILTRWQETDQYFRDVVSAELGYVHREIEPGVGMNIDNIFGTRVGELAGRMEEFHRLGARAVYVHHPGWQNGRDREPGQTEGGGDCSINDWLPLSNTREPWKNVSREAARLGISYHVWVTGMNWRDTPFHQAVGADLRNWAINRPGHTESSGYPPWHDNLNPLAPRCRDLFLERMAFVRKEYGYQGIWYDSFQNLFMSTLDWANGTGAPFIRPWWEILAAWSREGVAMTSESHAFPGNSCSIESDLDPMNSVWFAQHTFRWYRTTLPNGWDGKPEADVLAFRNLANKSWVAPQVQYGKKAENVISSFARFAAEYNAARPWMRRSYVLPEEKGVLWLHYVDDREGVLFAFADLSAPAGVSARPVTGGDAVKTLSALHGYRVSGESLPTAFGIPKAPLPDERIGRAWTDPAPVYPAWTK